MYDASFGEASLLRLITQNDVRKRPFLKAQGATEAAAAAALAEALFAGTAPLTSLTVHGKAVYNPASFQCELILRKVTRNLRHAFPSEVRGRRYIVETLLSHLREGLPYRAYKRDVYHFYPSFLLDEVMKALELEGRVSWLTKRLVEKILEGQGTLPVRGLPLGIGLSAILSELMMLRFDNHFRKHVSVRFYARYVDDIVIVTTGDEDQNIFERDLVQQLPKGLHFNGLKTSVQSTHGLDLQSNATSAAKLTYLGYAITIQVTSKAARQKTGRLMVVDLSPSKVKKLKTRIARALHSHISSPDFGLLQKRLAFLTSNASLPVAGQSVRRLIGIYHTYPLLTENTATALKALDKFLKHLLTGSTGLMCSALKLILTNNQRSQLMALSFVKGYHDRRFVSVSRHELAAIRKCWMND